MSPSHATAAPILQARSVSKFFGAITALRNVSLQVAKGEVLGVVGDNGAGKSTLMKVLSGLYAPSEGALLFEGGEVRFDSPRESRNIGIEMVYQDFALAGNMSIHENIFLGREVKKPWMGLQLLNKKAQREQAQEHLNRLKIHVKSVDQNVEDLSGGQRQAVAIARATAFDAKLVIMDEPTAALGVQETAQVENIIRTLKEAGEPLILVSHNMRQVFDLVDRIVVFRRGRIVANLRKEDTDGQDVVAHITGAKTGSEFEGAA
jgi:simple sugar transport system ATP-binding protein